MSKVILKKYGPVAIGPKMHVQWKIMQGALHIGNAYEPSPGIFTYGSFSGSKARLLILLNQGA
jgi:hypothetical protein